MTEIFCDWLSATFGFEDWETVRESVTPTLDAIGARVEHEDASGVLWRAGDGVVRAKRVGPVMALSATGAVLAGLRLVGAVNHYFGAIGSVPHNVTRVDVSCDIPCDTPAVLDSIVAKSHSRDGIALTRKRVHPKNVTRLVTRRSDGLDTGTCYVGGKTAEVRAAVYDKRQERIDRGLPDIGPLTRYELRIRSKIGATLRDASEPAPLFYHFMAPTFLPRPANIPLWASGRIGFDIDWPDRPLPAALLLRRLESSADIAALLRLAAEVGPRGFDFLVSRMRQQYAKANPSSEAALPDSESRHVA